MKSRCGLGLGKLPYIWGSPLIFLQLPRCPLNFNGASCILLCCSYGVVERCDSVLANEIALLRRLRRLITHYCKPPPITVWSSKWSHSYGLCNCLSVLSLNCLKWMLPSSQYHGYKRIWWHCWLNASMHTLVHVHRAGLAKVNENRATLDIKTEVSVLVRNLGFCSCGSNHKNTTTDHLVGLKCQLHLLITKLLALIE